MAIVSGSRSNGSGPIQNKLSRRLRGAWSRLQSACAAISFTPDVGASDLQSAEHVQKLESRYLLSNTAVDTTAVVDVQWKGKAVQAYQDQYVAETLHYNLFAALAHKEGFTDIQSLGGTGYYQFTSTLPIKTIEKFAAQDLLTFKELSPNAQETEQSTLPNDVGFSQQWGMQNTGQLEPYDYEGKGVVTPYNYEQYPTTPPANIEFPSPPYPNDNKYGLSGDDIDAAQAWDITTGSPNVVVAVLDTGIDTTHPDLIPNLWTNPFDTTANDNNGDGYPGDIHGYSFITNSGDVTDGNGHGTQVAGVIGAAGNNGIGIAGVNWNVKLLPVQVLGADGSGSYAQIIGGINYVTHLKSLGVNIVDISMSLGGEGSPIDVLESDAIKEAGRAGVLTVVAAGNSSDNLDNSVFSPAKFSAAYPSVVTVAAVDDQFQLAAFSNFGAGTVDLAAPGIDIYSTSPTYPVTLNTEVAQEPDIPQFPEYYGYLSGTSQATPTVSGIIALEAAANPSATPAELKAALLNGVTYDPNLASQNGLPAKVLTSGVANAYKAVLNILNYSTGTNSTRAGTWSGYYGSQGSYVVGESSAFPSGTNITLSGGSPVVLANNTTNVAAPQRPSDTSSRISAYEATSTSESINLSFTDGAAHEVELYLADLDHKNRVETVNLIDTTTGYTLSTQTVSKFSKGIYLNYDLRGPVTIQLVRDSGPSAVFSGLFVDYPDASPNTLNNIDTTTTGYNWRNQYGSQGALVVNDNSSYPAYVSSLNVTGNTGAILRKNTKASNALQKEDDVNSGIEAYWATTGQMDITLDTTDSAVHVVTLYAADFGNLHRSERISVIDANSGVTLDTQDITNFSKGIYVSFNITGDVIFRVQRTGGVNAVVSGVFFDAPAGSNVHFVGTDTTTHGNWNQVGYGAGGNAYVVGDDFPGLESTSMTISETGGTRKIVGVPTDDPAALYKTEFANSNIRVAAYLYTSTSMTLSYNPGDLNVHQVELYFADYENYHRTEAVTFYNGNTMQVLSHQVVSNFRKGKYLVFDVTGPVLIVINNGSYPNAVLSGMFVN